MAVRIPAGPQVSLKTSSDRARGQSALGSKKSLEQKKRPNRQCTKCNLNSPSSTNQEPERTTANPPASIAVSSRQRNTKEARKQTPTKSQKDDESKCRWRKLRSRNKSPDRTKRYANRVLTDSIFPAHKEKDEILFFAPRAVRHLAQSLSSQKH